MNKRSIFYSFRNGRQFGRIFFKNLAFLSLLILLPMFLLVSVATMSVSTFMNNEILSYSDKSLNAYLNLINTMLDDLLVQSHLLNNNTDIELFLLHEPDKKAYYDPSSIYTQIQTQMQTHDYLTSVYIYSQRNGRIISNYGDIPLEDFFDTGWLEEYQANTTPSRFWYTYRLGPNRQFQQIPMISIYKAIETQGVNQGVIVFNVNLSKFTKLLSVLREPKEDGLFLFDGDNRLLSQIWGDYSSIDPEFCAIDELMSAEGYIRYGGHVLYKASIHYSDWNLVLSVPRSLYQANIHAFMFPMVLIFTLGLLATIGLTVMVSFRLYRPIRSIMGKLEDAVPSSADVLSLKKDEEAYIISAIEHTVHQNKVISEDLEKRIDMLKKAQSIALQSQINPHFLHNTLDSISWSAMALTGGKNQTSIMINQLSSMLRYSLEDVNTLVPLERELDNARTYLDLQSARYKNKFQTEWQIDADVRSCLVIKILLQPLLENAIYHGIKPLSGMGHIRIGASRKGDILESWVEDTGVGIDSASLKRLQTALMSDDIQEKAHIGILNVNQRIRLIFGSPYGLHVYSEDKKGARILCQLPLSFD